MVLTDSLGTLRYIHAWDVAANKTRTISVAPLMNFDDCKNSYRFGELVSLRNITIANALSPKIHNDLLGNINGIMVKYELSENANNQVLEPYVKLICRGVIEFGMTHQNQSLSFFLINTSSEARTYTNSGGRLFILCANSGLLHFSVKPGAQNCPNPIKVCGSLVLLGSTPLSDGDLNSEFISKRYFLTVLKIISSEGAKSINLFPPANVVKLSRKGGIIVQDCDTYIGRRVARGGWDLPQSKWHNPFFVKGDTDEARAEAVAKYRQYLLSKPSLLGSLHELRGQRLGCWCKSRPNVPCHGDVLVDLLMKQFPSDF